MKFDKLPPVADDNGHVTSINGDIRCEPDPDTQCGFGSFRPQFLQVGQNVYPKSYPKKLEFDQLPDKNHI
jgi:hypothetical protein